LLVEARLPTLADGTGVGYAEDRRTSIFPHAAAIAAITVTDGVVTCSDTAIAATAQIAAEKDVHLLDEQAHRPKQRRAFQVLATRALRDAREQACRSA
jgi:aerobic carbon-monoxide dehydrogenase medium subunit